MTSDGLLWLPDNCSEHNHNPLKKPQRDVFILFFFYVLNYKWPNLHSEESRILFLCSIWCFTVSLGYKFVQDSFELYVIFLVILDVSQCFQSPWQQVVSVISSSRQSIPQNVKLRLQNKSSMHSFPTSSSGVLMSMCSNTMNSFFTLTGSSHGRCSSAFTQYLTLPCFPSKEVARALTDKTK